MEDVDEFDAIFQDGDTRAGDGDVQADAVNYKVSMDKYQQVDIFQASGDSTSASRNHSSPSRGNKYEVISSGEISQQMDHQADSPNTNNHGNTHTHQSSSANKASSQSASNGALRVQQPNQSHLEEEKSKPSSHDKMHPLEREDDKTSMEGGDEDAIDVLRKELPRDRTGTGGDPKELLVRAQAEWEAVGTIQPGKETITEGKASSINVTPLISFSETLAFFQRANMRPFLSKIKPTVSRSGISALRHLILGPPKVKASLQEERNLVFAIAQCPFDDNEDVHRRVLQTIYKQLTGSALDCPRYGDHWEQIGFQGVDPSTDLRACGFLGLMTLLHFVMDPDRLQLAKEIYRLSQHEMQNFPFSVMSINMTRIAIQSLREDSLSRECNRRKQVFGVINDFYAGIFLQLYQIWKHQQKTIKDSGFVIKDVELAAKKNPREVIRALETHLHGRADKRGGGSVNPVQSGDILEFVGVHELEVEDNG